MCGNNNNNNNNNKEKTTVVQKNSEKAMEGRLNEGPWLQRKHEDENEAKQNKGDTRERRHGICKPNARRIQVCAACGWSTRASKPARVRLLWAILSLVLPVRFSSWDAVVHWLALMPKALRSSRKYPIHSFSWPPTQPASATKGL